MRRRRLTPLLAVVLLGACGTETASGEPAGDPSDLEGRTFLSTGVTEDGQPRDLVDDTVVRLEFRDEELVASAGCNTIRAEAELDDGVLRAAGTESTGMGCDSERHEQDAWLAEFVGSDPSWNLTGDNLVLATEEARIEMVDRKVAEPDLPLEGTRWTVETILEGGPDEPAASAWSSSKASKAWLRIQGGRAEGNGGCNGFGGTADVTSTDSGARITFGPLVGTKMACEPEIMEVENHLLEVLRGDVTATIDADRLRLTSEDGRGVELRGKR